MIAHAEAVGEPGEAERTSTPGAMMLMQPPPLLKLAMSSPSWMAPTAITDGPLAGLSSHASASGQDAISPSCIKRLWVLNHMQAFLRGKLHTCDSLRYMRLILLASAPVEDSRTALGDRLTMCLTWRGLCHLQQSFPLPPPP